MSSHDENVSFYQLKSDARHAHTEVELCSMPIFAKQRVTFIQRHLNRIKRRQGWGSVTKSVSYEKWMKKLNLFVLRA